MSPRLHRTNHRQPAPLRVGHRRALSSAHRRHAPRALMMAVTARVAVKTTRPRHPHRYHRYPHRYHRRPRCHPPRHHLLLHRRPPRGRSPWASVTAVMPAARISGAGAIRCTASIRCRSAGRPRRRPPIVPASPMLRSTRCPLEAQKTGAGQPVPAAACCTSGQPSPRRAREKRDT